MLSWKKVSQLPEVRRAGTRLLLYVPAHRQGEVDFAEYYQIVRWADHYVSHEVGTRFDWLCEDDFDEYGDEGVANMPRLAWLGAWYVEITPPEQTVYDKTLRSSVRVVND